jgi:ribosomal protein S18 acetylase RimI-like enzyme
MSNQPIKIITAYSDASYAIAKEMFIAYQQFLGVDLCFQSFEEELNDLPAMYGAPMGKLLLAFIEDTPVGCVALRKKTDHICEMKRLYVPEQYRGLGIGKKLATAIVESAQDLQYQTIVLDTLERLTPALHVYTQLGFTQCAPYYANPLEGVRFMQRSL